jgi:hypothetical protein
MGKDLVFQMELAQSTGAPSDFESKLKVANGFQAPEAESPIKKFRRRATTVRMDMVRDRILAEESLMKAAELEESTERVNMLARILRKREI